VAETKIEDAKTAETGKVEDAETEKDEDTEEDSGAGDDSGAEEDAGDEKDSAGKDEGEEDKGDGFPAELRARASDEGFSEEEIASFGSAANLEKALTTLDSKLVEMGRGLYQSEDEDEEAEDEPKSRGKPAKSRKASGKSRKEDEDEDEDEFKLDLDPEEYPEINKALKGLQKHHSAALAARDERIADVLERLEAAEGRYKHETMMAVRSRVSRAFDEIAPEWGELFGKGEVSQGSKEFKNRLKVLETADIMAKVITGKGGSVPNDAELIGRAARVDFGKHAEAMTRKKLVGDAKKRSGQLTNRPTHRKSSPKSGRDAAIERQKAFDQVIDQM
jgi:hypothetical protein